MGPRYLVVKSGRRESNPQQQLGRLGQYHFATPAVGAAGLEPAPSRTQTGRSSLTELRPEGDEWSISESATFNERLELFFSCLELAAVMYSVPQLGVFFK